MCYRTGKYTVCRRVRASFSPEIVHAGTVKGLTFAETFVNAYAVTRRVSMGQYTVEISVKCRKTCLTYRSSFTLRHIWERAPNATHVSGNFMSPAADWNSKTKVDRVLRRSPLNFSHLFCYYTYSRKHVADINHSDGSYITGQSSKVKNARFRKPQPPLFTPPLPTFTWHLRVC